ncbi:pirin family protein [Streptosporangium sp. DT93]|uniref:pirin family protein n=1 Tax=Streptosporangium sp. DT93 TaxID=3393428 RepID=UPI003CF03A97
MSNLETGPREAAGGGPADVVAEPVSELLTGRDVLLGGPRSMRVTRILPNRDVRMVGAWCFVDHYGPGWATMRVPAHPHTGLQTVSWLLEGEILHRDSLGSEQTITPEGTQPDDRRSRHRPRLPPPGAPGPVREPARSGGAKLVRPRAADAPRGR